MERIRAASVARIKFNHVTIVVMKLYNVKFEVEGKNVVVPEYPELAGVTGFLDREGMAFFFGKGRAFYIANTVKGVLRKICSIQGSIQLIDEEIDYPAIEKGCRRGYENAVLKVCTYARVNRYDGFKNGLCALAWMLYPDGRYFADEDGFGMEDNDEENVYAIIDSDLDIVEPFRPVGDIEAHLKKIRKDRKCTSKTAIHNLIIIDESGSMESIRKEAVDSVNETIQTIRQAQRKHEDQIHFVSLVTFNDEVKTIYDAVSVNEIKELKDSFYNPCCCTALYDAMGISITDLRRKVMKEDKVLVTVVTDGYENASKEFTGKTIKSLVDAMKAEGWVFAYVGANQDVETVAAGISITNVMNFEATSLGTVQMSTHVDRARRRFFDRIADADFCADEANEDFFKE